ncbi:biliverdin-producing heme oxygenase [Pseudomonas sp. PDNC002]|uniref:biliverdin-producing heme oxygenase n=1 Tax=Pseudomonas sp. PDNC002 TaxID=2811422 RepID=UPI00196599A7|nr:biliverdin-producing heme oxygenase [Pseudomonas sp. PDNC002]QRY79823.1 biliverdin-producing heme oxygenase [Pseudomonas sp. PDNC002]
MNSQTNERAGISPALAALRAATHALHADLDSRSPLTASLSRADYLEHAARVLGWMRPLEQGLWQAWPDAADAGLRGAKSQWLESDLLDGGYDTERLRALPDCAAAPVATSRAEAFGIAYVAEGATLGGRVLYKRLRQPLEPLPLRWLQGYGDDTGERWGTFQRLLAEHVTSPEDIAQAQRAAVQAFTSFRDWVLDAPEARRTERP